VLCRARTRGRPPVIVAHAAAGHGVHHYYFKLYALGSTLDVEPGLDKKAIMSKIGDQSSPKAC